MSDEKDDKPELDPDERLRMENKIEKLKLSALKDAKFFSKGDLSPEIENEWLNYIQEFEKQAGNVEKITVAKRLGNPSFPPVEDLSEEEISENLDKVVELMDQHRLYLDTIAKVTEKEVYRFITEELFEHEIDDFDIEGMNTVFIYEEFHPNARIDIENLLDNFIPRMLSEKFRDNLGLHLSEECRTKSGDVISKEEAVNKSLSFGDLYDNFDLQKWGDFDIEVDENEQHGKAQFYIEYQAATNKKTEKFEGTGHATLGRGDLGYWNIVSLEFPGFSF